MGKDKALLPFDTYTTLSEFQYHKLSRLFEKTYISAKTNKFDFNCNLIEDRYIESSPLIGIVSLFETLTEDVVFILSVDAPLVDEKVIEKLWQKKLYLEKENHPIDAIIAQSPNGLQPLCGIYKRSILPLAQSYLLRDNHKLITLLKSSHMHIINFNDDTPFTNLNTTDEYKKLFTS